MYKPIQRTSWAAIRMQICNQLDANIPPSGLSSYNPANPEQYTLRFSLLTGLQCCAQLRAGVTSCNGFIAIVASQMLGLSKGDALCGKLDLSKARCWISAAEAKANKLYPQPGDFFARPRMSKGWLQPFGHVGIVYDYYKDSGCWRFVHGGQNVGTKMDRILWVTEPFNYDKISGWVDIAKYLLPNGPATSGDVVL